MLRRRSAGIGAGAVEPPEPPERAEPGKMPAEAGTMPAEGRTARVRRWTDRPAAPAVIVCAAAAGFVVLRLIVVAHGQVSRFVMAERAFADPARTPRGLAILPKNGYDGQFFYRLALNPSNLHHTAYGVTFDSAFRVQRIGYPVLAWAVSLGHHPWVPGALVIVNVAALTGIGWLGGVFARDADRHALWGLLLAGYFGFVLSLARDAAEPVAAACLLAGVLAYRRGRPILAAVFLAYGGLTRETVMVVVAAIAIVRLASFVRRKARPGREDLAWIGPAAVFGGWQGVIYSVTGSFAFGADAKSNSGHFLDAPYHAIVANLGSLSIHAAAVDAWVVEMAVLVFFVGAAAASLRGSSVPIHERIAFLMFIVELCVLSPGIWNGVADLRSLDEVYLFAVLILLASSRRLLASAITLSPALVIAIAHRTVSL